MHLVRFGRKLLVCPNQPSGGLEHGFADFFEDEFAVAVGPIVGQGQLLFVASFSTLGINQRASVFLELRPQLNGHVDGDINSDV